MSRSPFYTVVLVVTALLCSVGMPHSASAEKNTLDSWGAIAAGMWNDSRGGARVTVGAAIDLDTKAEATQGALAQCRAGGRNCKLVGTFSNGNCGYIAVGTRKGRGVTYGVGPTRASALEECRSGGYTCKKPIGGCTIDYLEMIEKGLDFDAGDLDKTPDDGIDLPDLF